jgi:hypothetical protein
LYGCDNNYENIQTWQMMKIRRKKVHLQQIRRKFHHTI